MKSVLLFFLLVVICIAVCSAEVEDDSNIDLQRSAREAAVGRKLGKHARTTRKPVDKKAPAHNKAQRKRRFKTRKNKHNRKHYERMMGLRAHKATIVGSAERDIIGQLRKVFAGTVFPKSFSWTTNMSNVVGLVKDQGQCGSCYTFSAMGTTASMLAIWNKMKVIDLSEQQIVDCSQSYGNNGCDGGLMTNVFEYVAHHPGVKSEKDYPYKGVVGKCRAPRGTLYANELTYGQIKGGDEAALQWLVYYVGPVSIGIHSNTTTLIEYAEGIYDDPDCTGRTDHAVILVGWGEENGEPYWLVKNSWGKDWGENGYIRIHRGSGTCNMGSVGTVPVPKWVSDKLMNNEQVRY